MHNKDIIGWCIAKDGTERGSVNSFCKARDVWWVKIGHNIGREIDGKRSDYSRPVVVIRSFGLHLFLAVPLTSKGNSSGYKIPVNLPGSDIQNYALIDQIRTIDTKRLINKIGTLNKPDTQLIKDAIKGLVE